MEKPVTVINMKTIIFFIAVTFGAVEIFADSREEINKCYKLTYFENGDCPNYERQIDCFSKIDPDDSVEQLELTEVIGYAKHMNSQCQGKNETDPCIWVRTLECSSDYDAKRDEKTKDLCNEIPAVRECYAKLNEPCEYNVIESYLIGDLDNHTALCKDGYYDGGPCSALTATACTSDFDSVRMDDHPDDLFATPECQASIVDPTRSCLKNLMKTCKAASIQTQLGFELYLVNFFCPEN